VRSLARIVPALCVVAAIHAAERGLTVTAVDIEGCKQVHPDRVRFVTTVRAGKIYGADRSLPIAMADDVKAIERMGPFTGTRSEVVFDPEAPGKVRVVYHVTELPYVTGIVWEGLEDTWFVVSDLEKAIATRVGGYANPMILDNDLQAIRRHFRAAGDHACGVDLEQRPAPGGIVLAFRVIRGPTVKIASVQYLGLPDGMRRYRFDRLLDRSQVNRPGRPYQPDLLPIDQGDVVRVLQEEGWLDARLTGVDVETTDYVRPLDERRRNGPASVPDGVFNDRVHLIYSVEGGARYRLGEVSFVGNTVAGADQLREAFALERGAWYRREDVAAAIERARRVISNQGYARCRISPDRRFDLDQHIVDLVLLIDEGRPYKVGRIDIKGNLVSRDAVIRRGVQLAPGELWNDDKAEESRRQILRTGLFRETPQRPLALEPTFPEDRPDQTDLVIRVDESDTGSIQANAGFSTATGLFLSFGYTERNFDMAGALADPFGRWRGGGQDLSFNASWSEDRSTLGVIWGDPSVVDGPYSNAVSFSLSDSTQRAWDEVRVTTGDTVGRNFLLNDLRVTLPYSYSDIRIREVQADAPDDAVPGKHYVNTFGIGFAYDRLNNAILPTSGYVTSANLWNSGWIAGTSDPITEYQLKGEGFLPLAESEDGGVTFVHLGARWKQAIPIAGNTGVPFYQRYLGGGPAPRHRGFAYNEMGPKEINHNGLVAEVGGDRDLIATTELSYPLQGINDGVRIVGFLDIGNVWAEGAQATVGSLRYAYGFGLRFPMAFPISLDFAWLYEPKPGEAPTQIHFGLGQVRF
jgi:outer membrane protein insertion porin family